MTKLVIMRGLPASGKTTHARIWVSEDNEHRVRVNRDDLRAMIHDSVFVPGGTYSGGGTEQTIIKMRDTLIDEALCSGLDVISDDTNLPSKVVKQLLKIAKRCGAEAEVIDLTDVPLDECLKRNLRRKECHERGVPDEVIKDMWMRYLQKGVSPLPVPVLEEVPGNMNRQQYVPNEELPRAVIFDIDGTVAHMNGRSPYDYSLVSTDTLDRVVADEIDMHLTLGYDLLFVSGRKHECRGDTIRWLESNLGLSYADDDFALFMRADGDERNDAIVKYEIFDREIRPHYNVRCVYDDRNRVVEMWRSIGLKCLQVADGDF